MLCEKSYNTIKDAVNDLYDQNYIMAEQPYIKELRRFVRIVIYMDKSFKEF